MKNTYVLAFDCSTPVATVALNEARREVPHGRQAAELVPVIEALMKHAGIGYRDLDCMVSTIGPGSFTGLRIALATLHGLALASGVKVKTLTSTEAVAWAVAQPHFLVALNAGKGEAFMQEFKGHEAVGAITLHPQSIVSEVALPCYSNLLPPEHPYYVAGPDAAVLARIASHLPVTGLDMAMPYYIREADAKIPKPYAWLAQ